MIGIEYHLFLLSTLLICFMISMLIRKYLIQYIGEKEIYPVVYF